MARISKFIKKADCITLENVVGVLLAILIIFNLKLDAPLSKALNNIYGWTFSAVIVVILFVTMHPVIAILFAIYLYQNIKNPHTYHEKKKDNVLQQMNPPQQIQVEEIIIAERAPIKNQNQNNNVSFNPISTII